MRRPGDGVRVPGGSAMKRNVLRSIAKFIAGALLFGQLAVAAYACPQAVPTATAPGAASQELETPMPGCDGSIRAMDPASPNLCAEHCKYGQQSDHASTVTVPVVALTVLYATPTVPAAAPPPRPAAASISALVAASPPHAIAHCVFRI